MIEHLRSYFDSGTVVCPYARTTHKYITSANDFVPDAWIAALLAREASVIMTEGARDYEQARKWCFLTIDKLEELIPNTSTLPMQGEIKLPFFYFGAETFYVIGMGPQYDEQHPRYAPYLCLVAVNERSIRETPLEKREPIRRAMAARAGKAYSADSVWLPLNLGDDDVSDD